MARVMSAAEFKAKCLRAMEQVAETGEPIVITKRGKPLVQLVPLLQTPKTLGGFLEGRAKSTKDIVSPIRVKWNAARA